MVCKVAGPHSPGFLPMGTLEIMHIQKLPTYTVELKHAIWDEIKTINRELWRLVFDNFVNRFRQSLVSEKGTIKMLPVYQK
jgi:hypothetical protein